MSLFPWHLALGLFLVVQSVSVTGQEDRLAQDDGGQATSFSRRDVEESKEVEQWTSFKLKYDKRYNGPEEEARRMTIFLENLKMIRTHNVLNDLGLEPYRLGLNEFSDMDSDELRPLTSGYHGRRNQTNSDDCSTFLFPDVLEPSRLPAEVDWRVKGLVTPVKYQTGSLEGQHYRKTGKLVSLSEQDLVDCSSSNKGCNGGWVQRAFLDIESQSGIDSEDAYPYKGKDGKQCRFTKAKIAAAVTGCVTLPRGDEEALKQAVATVGPISVAIDAGQPSFRHYKSGVYVEPRCGTTVTNHAVLVVGYGTDAGTDYWLVKNSWGRSWGMDGYIKMARNQGDMCGVATDATYPLV